MSIQPVKRSIRCLGLADHQIFQVICIFGAIVQISYVLQRYFTFDYVTRITIKVPDVTKLPDVSICFDLYSMINLTKLYQEYQGVVRSFGLPSQVKPSTEHLIIDRLRRNDLISNLTVRQTWDLMLSTEMLIISATFRRCEPGRRPYQDPCSNRNFFRKKLYCILISCSTVRPAIAEARDLLLDAENKPIFTLALNHAFFRKFSSYYLTLTPWGSYPVSQRLMWTTSTVYPDPRNQRFFFYSLTVNNLPAPYPTNCRNYSKSGYPTQIIMKENCQMNLAINKTGAPLTWSLINRKLDCPFGFTVFNRQKYNQSFRSIIDSIVDHCNQITRQPDCLYELFIPSTRAPVPISHNATLITIDPIKDPVYRLIIEPKMTFLEMVIMIGSVLGTWLGFSILHHIPKIVQLCFHNTRLSELSRRVSERENNFNQQSFKAFYPVGSVDYQLVNRKLSSNDNFYSSVELPFYLYYDRPKNWRKPSQFTSNNLIVNGR